MCLRWRSASSRSRFCPTTYLMNLRMMNRHVTGKEHLKFSKLRDDAMTINMTAKCCDTLLCGQSTRYHGNAVCTWPCAARFSSPLKHGGDPFDVTRLRCWIADWPKAKYEKLWSADKVPGWFMVRDKVHYHGAGAKELYDHFRLCLLFGPADEWPGESFGTSSAAGGKVESLGSARGRGQLPEPRGCPAAPPIRLKKHPGSQSSLGRL